MDKKVYFTLIKRFHKFGDNHYVRGRISGIALCMSGFKKEAYANMMVNEGIIISNYFTQDEYNEFMKRIEELYSGLCIFNYDVKKES